MNLKHYADNRKGLMRISSSNLLERQQVPSTEENTSHFQKCTRTTAHAVLGM